MPHSTKPVRIALVLYIEGDSAENVAKVLESIRKQSQVPYYLRMVIGSLDNDVRFDPIVEQAVFELKEFVPNVVTMLGSREKNDGLILATNSLDDKDYDVLMIMNDDIVLPVDTLFHMSNPYLWTMNLLTVDAVIHDGRYKLSVWKNLFTRVMARSLIQGFFRVGRVGVVSASRKITARSNIGEMKVPFWHDVRYYETADPKVVLYY